MSLRAQRSNLGGNVLVRRDCFVAALLAMTCLFIISSLARAAEPQHCLRPGIVLWGDGRHDDSAALNAWFSGAAAIWAESGEPVGASIAGHSFRLSAPLYVS